MMDYHSIHGHDVSSFDLPSTHRLPTVSAAKALDEFDGNEKLLFIPTKLPALDTALSASVGTDGGLGLGSLGKGPQCGGGPGAGGVQRGQVTEIWGPPGVGKTSFGLQLAASCLLEDSGVVWVDAFHRVPVERLLSAAGSAPNDLKGFIHFTCPSLAHFLALLCRPTVACVPPGTSLVIVDSLSALINHAFPKTPEPRTVGNVKGSIKGPSRSARRIQVLHHIVGGLQKLAASRDIAIVVLTQCATKMQAERGATLIPAINAGIWEQGISTRLVLFHDWVDDDGEKGSRQLRFAGIQKLNGSTMSGLLSTVCAFRIQPTGLFSVEYDNKQASTALMSTPAPKRKLADTNFEIPDSDDEDYGWQVDDEDLPPNPSQWQGSEDLLLQPPESDDDNDPEDIKPLDTEPGLKGGKLEGES